MPRSKLLSELKIRVKRMGVTKLVLRFGLEEYRTGVLRAARLTKGIQNKVVFSCFNARTYGDNLKPISEKLHELSPDTEIVWMFRDPKGKKKIVPEYVRCVDPISVKGLCEYGTARVWVDNFTLARYLKRKMGKQFYLNPWHGDRPFKKVAYDMFPERRLRIEETCDTMMAGSEFGEKMVRSAFRYKGDILNVGCPRNDCLVNFDIKRAEAIKTKLGIDRDTMLLLYAPTFRDSTRMTAFESTIDFEKTLDLLEKKYNKKWACLYRAHQLQKGGLSLSENKRMLDMTSYEDMADLLLISDGILTDYSSSATDFCIKDGLVLLYQDDIEEYTSIDRELYYPMESTPFYIAHDMTELEKIINGLTDEGIKENCEKIRRFYGFRETGDSARAAAERIVKWLTSR